MPCRVGISTDPNRRKGEWNSSVVGLSNWRVYGPYTRSKAQDIEDDIARKYGCKAHHGGNSTSSNRWYVYTFNYLRSK